MVQKYTGLEGCMSVSQTLCCWRREGGGVVGDCVDGVNAVRAYDGRKADWVLGSVMMVMTMVMTVMML